jgi:hypothetical protein
MEKFATEEENPVQVVFEVSEASGIGLMAWILELIPSEKTLVM